MKLPSLSKKLRGVAILIVLVSLVLMMAIVTELSSKELVYYKLAINERNALQAEALAQSGANFAQVILTVQEPLQGYLTKFAEIGIQLPNYTVWELLPLDSELLKGIAEGFVPDFGFGKTSTKDDENTKEVAEKKRVSADEKKPSDSKKKEVKTFGTYEVPEGGYGAFDGHFSTLIEDEEKKISIRRWTKLESFPKRKMVADLIFRVLNKPENAHLFDGTLGNKNITPSQIVGNIYDYLNEDEGAVDVAAQAQDWGKILSGNKKSLYDPDMPEIQPRRAPMDSLAELRLIPGINDAIYQELARYLTIYGESDKINILTVSDEMLASIFYLCAKNRDSGVFQQPGFSDELVASWKKKKNDGHFKPSAEGIIAHLEENRVEVDKKECTNAVGTEAKTFTVKSTATVGNVTKTLIMRLRSAGGITTIYQYQYL